MNRRDGYANGRAFPSKESNNISISPHRFQPRSHPARQRRKQLFIRLAIAAAASLVLLLVFIPSLRSTTFAVLSLGLLSGPPELQLETVRYYDLSNSGGTEKGWEREERVLMCAPLRDAESHLPMFFAHLNNYTYPHHLIDLAFLVSDSKDNTLELLNKLLSDLQSHPDPKQPYGEISVINKDFGQKVNQDVESRHGFAAQASRRKLMAQARNWLLSAALRPTHSWVYWRDVDVETAPFTILEDLMRHNKDVIVPNVWRPLPDWLGGEQPYDLNSWQESETALALADTLDEDAVIVEGYAEYATWRPHLAYLRDPYGDPDMEMEIDGVGGVSILAKAKVFRNGVHFPAFSFEKHAETEGFGKMAKRMQYSVVGLPHYTVWHLYEPSVDDIRHMEEMEQERKNREQEEKERADRAKKIKEDFDESAGSQWEKDKNEMQAKGEQIKKEHDAAIAAKDGKSDSKEQGTSKDSTEKKDAAGDSSSKDSTTLKDTKESKGSKESKDSKDTKDSKESKDAKDTKDSKDAKDSKESKVTKDSKDSKDTKDLKDTKDSKASKDSKDSKDTKESKDSKDSRNREESDDSKDSKDSKDIKETKESKDSKATKESKDPEDSKASAGKSDSKTSKDGKDGRDTSASKPQKEGKEEGGAKGAKAEDAREKKAS